MNIENNITLFVISMGIAVLFWFASKKIKKIRIRRAFRISIFYLVLPVPFFGHPFLYYQVWTLLANYFLNAKLGWLLGMILIWIVMIVLSQIGIKNVTIQRNFNKKT